MNRLTFALVSILALSSMTLSAPAFAQSANSSAAVDGRIERLIEGPGGAVRGFVMDNGATVETSGIGRGASPFAVGMVVRVEGRMSSDATIRQARVTVNGRLVYASSAGPSYGH